MKTQCPIVLEKLTDADRQLLKKYRDEWKLIGMTTDRCDRALAEESITKIYKEINYEKPQFVWCESPLQAQKLINKKLENKKPQYIPTNLLGNQDAFWVAYYLWCRDMKIPMSETQERILDIWKDITLSCGWWYPYDEICYCCERPTEVHANERGQMDSMTSPAMQYADGWKLYSVRGVAVPAYIIEHPEQITIEKIDAEKNQEIKLIMRDRMGIERYLQESNATLIHMDMIPVGGIDEDKYMPRALMRDKEKRQYLVCTDSSTQNKVFYMQVDPAAKTCSEAHLSISNIPDTDIIANG